MRIALFFTERMSLWAWHEVGIVERDSLLYEKLCAAGHEVYFVTYGASDDREYLPPDSKIQVLSRPDMMGYREYSWAMWRVHREILQNVDVFKSHQAEGARYAAYAKLRLNKPYIARYGYLKSYFMAQEGASSAQRYRNALEEFIASHAAKLVCAPSQPAADYLKRRYRLPESKLIVCPNWVDTSQFDPDLTIPKDPRHIIFVGRIHPQKDPLALIEALRGLPDIRLTMVGQGPLEVEVQARCAEYGLKAAFIPYVNNADLPALLNSAGVFALPSHYEGSPKALYEAMACGLPVVATDAFGVGEHFSAEHGVKIRAGDVDALREAIQYLVDHPDAAAQKGAAARGFALEHYSVEAALVREIDLLGRIQA